MATGFTLTLAALALSRGPGALADAHAYDGWIVALLGGLAAGGAWWFEHRPSRAQVTRQLDERLGLGGALATAYEWSGERSDRTPPSRVADCLVARVSARMNRRDVRRAIAPSSALPIAAPFLAVALYAVLGEGIDRARGGDWSSLAQGVAGALEDAELVAGETADGAGPAAREAAQAERELASLAARVRRLDARMAIPRSAKEEQSGLGPDVAAELDRFERELGGLRRRDLGSDVNRAIDRARAWVDAARGQAPAEAAGADPTASGAETTPADTSGRGSPTDSSGASPGAASGDPAGDPAASADSGPAPEAGSASARTWPARHARIVERWVEMVRSGAIEADQER